MAYRSQHSLITCSLAHVPAEMEGFELLPTPYLCMMPFCVQIKHTLSLHPLIMFLPPPPRASSPDCRRSTPSPSPRSSISLPRASSPCCHNGEIDGTQCTSVGRCQRLLRAAGALCPGTPVCERR